MPDFAANLRRLMSRDGVSVAELSRRAGLDLRTVRAVLNGRQSKPRAQTLHRLALGLGVSADELFQNPALLARRSFDRRTNPCVEEVIGAAPEEFEGWTEGDFDELHSRVGVGGGLTTDGVRQAVAQMNHKRTVHEKVAVLLESGEAGLLTGVVDLLYQRIVISDGRLR